MESRMYGEWDHGGHLCGQGYVGLVMGMHQTW